MANITLSELVKLVLRKTGQNPGITAFSDKDDTQWLVDEINNAIKTLLRINPITFDQAATITITAGNRTASLPSAVDPLEIYSWSWYLQESGGNTNLSIWAEEGVKNTYPNYLLDTAPKPELVYLENTGLGVYPIPSANAVIGFQYPARVTAYTGFNDVLPFDASSDEVDYLRLKAQYEYEAWKGIGQPLKTAVDVDDLFSRLTARYYAKKIKLKGKRKYAQ